MAFIWQVVLLLSFLAAAVNADMKLDCGPDFVTLVWTESRSQADLSLLHLGNCFPNIVSGTEAEFNVELGDCNFRKMVTGDTITYTNDLTYDSTPDSVIVPYNHPVVCVYERPKDWYPVIYEPTFHTYGLGELTFYFGFMNDDFSGPAESTSFSLGSLIHITASVEQKSHQPLLLLLEECVAATTPELQHDSNVFPIINNKGCLVDSKRARSRFEPRVKSSEIRLTIQAFRFADGEEVFLHCQLAAWNPIGLDNGKKACHYVKDYGWELLDNPSYSQLCDCCESSCNSRRARSIGASGNHGAVQKAVLKLSLT